jgi:hypothetical protein
MVDLQKIVDKWSIDKGSDVMLPWLGSTTCGEAAIAIADALRQIAELRAERDNFAVTVVNLANQRDTAEAHNARLSEALAALMKEVDREDYTYAPFVNARATLRTGAR